MPGLLTKKWKCKQRAWVTGKARTKHDKIKFMTYLQCIQQSWREEKEKNKKKKINMHQLHNSTVERGVEVGAPWFYDILWDAGQDENIYTHF